MQESMEELLGELALWRICHAIEYAVEGEYEIDLRRMEDAVDDRDPRGPAIFRSVEDRWGMASVRGTVYPFGRVTYFRSLYRRLTELSFELGK